jgi:hypothetical protein
VRTTGSSAVQQFPAPEEKEARKMKNPKEKVVMAPSMDERRRPPGAAPGEDDMSTITIISKFMNLLVSIISKRLM